jgi:hypothetical protein
VTTEAAAETVAVAGLTDLRLGGILDTTDGRKIGSLFVLLKHLQQEVHCQLAIVNCQLP